MPAVVDREEIAYGCRRLGIKYSKNIYEAKIMLTLIKATIEGHASSGKEAFTKSLAIIL
jgi:hypothetical protein